jgi:acetyl esterase/lipase
LYPTAKFPTQLIQAVSALEHLFSRGIKPADLYLVGDSAGGALILQILSHLLHPYPNVPKLELDQPFCGIFLMSPWVSLSTSSPSFITNSDSDVLPKETWGYLASGITKDLPETGVPYLEALRAPDHWWNDLKNCVKRICIYAGEVECLRDDILTLAEKLKQDHDSIDIMVQKGGVHTDPYLNRLAGEKDDVEVKEFILRFLKDH